MCTHLGWVALFTMALVMDATDFTMAALLCFAGALRVREALLRVRGEIQFTHDGIVIILERTKRGCEQKVVLLHPTVLAWWRSFCILKGWNLVGPPDDAYMKAFDISYSNFLKRLRQFSAALGLESLQLTSHSVRRSAATVLSMKGYSEADIMAFGWWASPRAARESVWGGRGDPGWGRIRRWPCAGLANMRARAAP